MAKMTDKKPGKAKAKVKTKAKAKAKAGSGAQSHAATLMATPAIRQPGVERRKNHPARA